MAREWDAHWGEGNIRATHDDDACSSEPDVASTADYMPLRRRVMYVVLGLTGLAVCVVSMLHDAGGAAAPSPIAAESAKLPAPTPSPAPLRALLEGPRFANVVADNMMRNGQAGESDRGILRQAVASHLTKVNAKLSIPMHEKLDFLKLTQDEQEAALHSLRVMGDPRALELGKALGQAIEQARTQTGDESENLRNSIFAALVPHLGTIRALREEVLPVALRAPGHQASQWSEAPMATLEAFRGRGGANSLRREASRRLLADTTGSIRDHVLIFFDLMSEKFGTPFEVEHGDTRPPPGPVRRLLEYKLCSAQSNGIVVVGCPTECQGSCVVINSLFECIQEGGGFACVSQGFNGAFDSTFGYAWQALKNAMNFN